MITSLELVDLVPFPCTLDLVKVESGPKGTEVESYPLDFDKDVLQ